MKADRALPATLIQRCLEKYIAEALRTNTLIDPPVDALRFAAATLVKQIGSGNLRAAERAVGEEFAFRLELRLVGNTTGHAGACVRHVRAHFEREFRLLN
jgi:hypothetical protein